MGLDLDRAWLDPRTLAGVLVGEPRVGPIRGLVAIHPGRQVRTTSDDGHGEPLSIPADQAAGQLAVIQGTRAVNDGTGGVAAVTGVEDLRFVAVHEIAGYGSG